MFLTSVIVVCGLVNAICLGLDKLPRVATRRRVHDWLEGLWLTLDGTRILKMPQVMASESLLMVQNAIGPSRRPVRSVCILVVSSLALTIISCLIGLHLDGDDWRRLLPWPRFIGLLVVNFIFDTVTVFFTFHVLQFVAKSRAFVSFFLIILDIYCAVVFASFCLGATGFTEEGRLPIEDLFRAAVTGQVWDLRYMQLGYASTTLLPTVAYMSVLGAMLLGQLAVKVVMSYAERATDDDPRDSWAFRILGIVVAMVGALAIAVEHFV